MPEKIRAAGLHKVEDVRVSKTGEGAEKRPDYRLLIVKEPKKVKVPLERVGE